LSDLVKRAGGLTDYANPDAAIFLRDALLKREQEQLARFKQQLERDLAALELEGMQAVSDQKNTEALGEAMLADLDAAKAQGRLVIDLPSILARDKNSDNQKHSVVDLELKDKDRLIIPQKSHTVSVVGEIQFPTSHLYTKKNDVFDYIDISGGYSSRADKKHMYVIKANGQVASVKNGWLFKRNTKTAPGDTVVVPYDIYASSPMVKWTGISQILFQLATTVAALDAVGVF